MQQSLRKQRGMTGLGWLLILVIIGFFTLLIFKLAPAYLENYTIKSVLHSLEEEPLITTKSKRDIEKMVMARLNTNGVRDLKSESIKIESSPGRLRVTIAYNIQKNILGNVDVLMKFNDSVEMVAH